MVSVLGLAFVASLVAGQLPASGQFAAQSAPSPLVVATPDTLTPVRAIANPSFDVDFSDNGSHLVDAANGSQTPSISGWSSTHPPTATDGGFDHPIEVKFSGTNGTDAVTGDTFIELNAEVASAVFQDLCLQANEPVDWSFWHAARTGGFNEIAKVTISDPASWTDVVPPASPAYQSPDLGVVRNERWKLQSGSWTGPTTAGAWRFAFDVVQGAPTPDIGNLVDDVSIDIPALVEFYAQAGANPTSTTEADGALLLLVLNGRLDSPQQFRLEPTAASTVDGADLTITSLLDGSGDPIAGGNAVVQPDGAIVVNMPAGLYLPNDRSAYVQIPVDLADGVVDAGERADWTIVGSPGELEPGDALCDGSGNAALGFDIGAGLDLALTFSTPDTPANGGDVVWTAIVDNIDALGEPGPLGVEVTFSPAYNSLGGSGLGWSCSNNPLTIACFFVNPLGPGETTPPLTILTTVVGNAGDAANATATATGVGIDGNLANNTVGVVDTVESGLPATGVEHQSNMATGISLILAGAALIWFAHVLDFRSKVIRAGMRVISASNEQWRR